MYEIVKKTKLQKKAGGKHYKKDKKNTDRQRGKNVEKLKKWMRKLAANPTNLNICYKDTKNPQKCHQLSAEKCCKNKNLQNQQNIPNNNNKKLTRIKNH